MSESTPKLVPTPELTIGPFHGYALPYEGGEQLVERSHPRAVRLHGTVHDGRGEPVPDALLEVWQADGSLRFDVHLQGPRETVFLAYPGSA
ncbi:hypothetical protein [Kocuria rhizophila]|uniref:hypothetical protein n=1 Tax=Kocuria rhizophila TaxID=72000 RepID=UPI00073D8CED|nr:hypothetical protein [Kocuria rhizophila]